MCAPIMTKSPAFSLPLCVKIVGQILCFGVVLFNRFVSVQIPSYGPTHGRRTDSSPMHVPELLMFTPSQGSCHANYAINGPILTSLLVVDHSSDSHTVRFKEPRRVLGNLLLWLGAMETFSRPIRGLYSCIGCLLANDFLNEMNCGLRLVCGGGYLCRYKALTLPCPIYLMGIPLPYRYQYTTNTCQYTDSNGQYIIVYSSCRCPYYNITAANKTLLMSRRRNFSSDTCASYTLIGPRTLLM